MRVVRRLAANTADVVGLGEDLQLRIEIDQVTNQSPVFTCNLLARLESHLCFLFLEKLQSVDGQSQISLQFIVVGARGKHFLWKYL